MFVFDMKCFDCGKIFLNEDVLLDDENESYCACPFCKSENIEDMIEAQK